MRNQLLPCSGRREYICGCEMGNFLYVAECSVVLTDWEKEKFHTGECEKRKKREAVEFLIVFKSSSFFTQHLEQEKHELRRRFENREGEWEGRVSELESDVKQLQDELERQQVHLREADREKTRAVQELSEQNQRLLDQLSRVSHE